MKDGKGPVAVALVALTAACVASFVIGTPRTSVRGPEAARSFLATWRENRMATFVITNRYTRTFPDGQTIEQQTVVVQRPPDDRILSGLGSVAGRLGGKLIRCASSPVGTSRCFTTDSAPDYAAEVDDEIGGLEAYLEGDRPLYRVIEFAEGPGECFRLDLALQLPSPPYGDHALFCFDAGNHALRLMVVERPEATDRVEAIDIRTEVTPADVQIPTEIGDVVGVPGQTTTTTSSG